jgi:NADH-ubiquinone oxidoreductase chain 6
MVSIARPFLRLSVLVSGLMVARAKNPVHSVLFPILVFRDTSGLLLLLGLDFSAMIFPVVHIGAIAVSFLFIVMMFHIQIAEIHEEILRYLPVSGIIGLILWWEMLVRGPIGQRNYITWA